MLKKTILLTSAAVLASLSLGVSQVAADDMVATYVEDQSQLPAIDFTAEAPPMETYVEEVPVRDPYGDDYAPDRHPRYELPAWALPGGADPNDWPEPPAPPSIEPGYVNNWNTIGVYDPAGPIVDDHFINHPIYDLSGLSAEALARIEAIRAEYSALEDREFAIYNQAPYYIPSVEETAELDAILDQKTALAIELEQLYLSAP